MTLPYKILLLIAACCLSQGVYAQSYVTYYKQGEEAFKKGDYHSFRDLMIKADSLRPNHPVIMYNLAKGYVLNGQNDEALKTLGILSHFYAAEQVLDSTDFRELVETRAWERLNQDFQRHGKEKMTSEIAFRFEKAGFHPEGIAYNAAIDLFYLTDIRQGWIYTFTMEDETLKPFVNLSELGFWSAMGVALDPLNPCVLWVVTSAVPQFEGYHDGLEGKSALLKLDASTGKLLKTYTPKAGGGVLGDFALTSTGKIYIADSRQPFIYTIGEQSDSLTKVFQNKDWWNLQGITFSDDEELLYVSDYITGVYRIAISSGKIDPLIAQNEWLRGGDGIYQKNNKLIILQNGTTPKRVAKISLNKEGYGIPETLEFTDQARDDMQEPTLGAWVQSDLYYIGNSPWAYYDKSGKPRIDKWPTLNILCLKVNSPDP